MDEQLMHVMDAARMVGMSRAWLRYKADVGEIPVVKTSRGQRLFRPSDLARFIEAQHAPGKSERGGT